jgi:hypothetical protein
MKSDENYMSWQDHEIAREWIDSLRPLSPDKLDKRAAVMLHSTGLRLEVDLNLVQKQPEKTIEILNDSHWTTTEENRNIIESWLDKQERKSQDELVVNGGKYDRQDPLSRLKQLADSLVDEQFQQLTPEEAKKLLIWIHTKEKYGDDYYKDPIAPQPQPRLSAVPSNDLKKQQRAMTEIIAELEQSVVQEKQKKKDKEEPFPSI